MKLRQAWWLGALAVIAVALVVLVPLASPDPDGLERVAQEVGFSEHARADGPGVLPEYSVPAISDGTLSTVAAGLIGLLLVFGVTWVLAALLARRSRHAGEQH